MGSTARSIRRLGLLERLAIGREVLGLGTRHDLETKDELDEHRLQILVDLAIALELRPALLDLLVEGITVLPDEPRIEVQIRKIPALRPGDSTCELVAGAGFEPATFGL